MTKRIIAAAFAALMLLALVPMSVFAGPHYDYDDNFNGATHDWWNNNTPMRCGYDAHDWRFDREDDGYIYKCTRCSVELNTYSDCRGGNGGDKHKFSFYNIDDYGNFIQFWYVCNICGAPGMYTIRTN